MRIAAYQRCAAFVVAATALSLGIAREARAQITFNFVGLSSGSTQDNLARQGFIDAGNLWSAVLSDQITVNINIGFSNLGGGILAQAQSETIFASYNNTTFNPANPGNTVRARLIADATSSDDNLAVSNLQSSQNLSFVTNNADGSTFVDTNNSNNNIFLDVNRANAKALGLTASGGFGSLTGANDTATDASITFSSAFTYDFDRTINGVTETDMDGNGIDDGAFDFVGLAVHEIGHALGFVSGVDIVDGISGPNAPFGAQSGDNFALFSVLDLYRYSADPVTQVAGFAVPDLRQGGTPYFSLDRGQTNLGLFSTGQFDGDGRQASHWKDDLGLGVMDPTAGFGERLTITELDLRAFDTMGYNRFVGVVPEPGSLALAAFGLIAVTARRRSRHRRK